MASLASSWMVDSEAATSALVYAEVIEGLKGRPNFDTRHRELHVLLQEIAPYFLSYPILERCGDLRRQLRRPHGAGLIGDIDTLIAATALEHRLSVVTTDQDFTRVPGLDVMLLDRRTLTVAPSSGDEGVSAHRHPETPTVILSSPVILSLSKDLPLPNAGPQQSQMPRQARHDGALQTRP